MALLEVMGRVPDGDVLIYADAGCTVSSSDKAREEFGKWVSLVTCKSPHRLAFRTHHAESVWCKADTSAVLKSLGPPVLHDVYQFCGGIVVMMNNSENRSFVSEWLDLMVRDEYHLVTDAPSRLPESKDFSQHRHDQAIFSGLCKVRNAIVLESVGSHSPIILSRKRHG